MSCAPSRRSTVLTGGMAKPHQRAIMRETCIARILAAVLLIA